jgi:hypothetical protein
MLAVGLFVLAGLLGVVAVGGWLVERRADATPDESSYQVIVALHLIRRRLHVSQAKVELRRDAADVRRRLCRELDELDRRERGEP